MSQKSTEERKAETKAALDTLHSKITALATDEAWLETLKTVSKFHGYSFLNTLWMMIQRADQGGTLVLPQSKTKWGEQLGKGCGRDKKSGEFVCKCGRTDGLHAGWIKKGEKALSVLAPIVIDKRDENGNKYEPPKKIVVGFTLRRGTFDAHQIVGGDEFVESLSALAPQTLEGSGDEALKAQLLAFAEAEGWTVSYVDEPANEANGWCIPDQGTVFINTAGDRSETHQLKTLAHEFGHMLLHSKSDLSREVKEVEAESVAYLVMSAFGIDSADYSVKYVATWAGEVDGKTLLQSATRITKAADQIISTVG